MNEFGIKYPGREVRAQDMQRLLVAWPNLRRLSALDLYITSDDLRGPGLPPLLGTIPSRLHSLELYIHDGATLALLAAIVEHSVQTLTHLAFEYSSFGPGLDIAPEELVRLHEAVVPAAATLASLHYRPCEDGFHGGMLDCVPAVLGALPNLRALRLPVSTVDASGMLESLAGRAPIALCVLEHDLGASDVSMDQVAELFEAVRVEHVQVDESWLEQIADEHVNHPVMYDVERWTVEEANDVRAEWEARMRRAVARFELV